MVNSEKYLKRLMANIYFWIFFAEFELRMNQKSAQAIFFLNLSRQVLWILS